MKKILLPTDFSNNAQNALNYALNLFKNEPCKFYLLNTYTPIIYSYDYRMSAGGYLGEIADVVRENSLEKLEEIEKELNKNFKNQAHQFEVISSFNLLTDEIKDIVNKQKIDLIVMGTKGASGVKEVLFGSNTIHTIKKAECPVLAIPDGYLFEEPKEVLFPTDYKINYSKKQLDVIKTIVQYYTSTFHVLHVSQGLDLSEAQNKNKNKLESLLANVNKAFYNVGDNDIPEAINEFQKTTYVQLLMMVNNKHSFFENVFFKPVINQIGFHLKVPFLVIPAKM